MAQGGLMVNVGTGNAFSASSFGLGTTPHSMYGMWDRGVPLGRPQLQRRSYTRHSDGTVTISATTAMDWTQYKGWAIDLPGDGEAVLTDPSFDAGVLSFVTTRPKNLSDQCNALPANSLYTVDPISGLPQRNTQGTLTQDGSTLLVAGKDIADSKVRILGNRRSPPKTSCTAGEAGCVCQGAECSKDAPRCGPGQRSLSAIGRGTDATICYSSAPRLQWREISGLRTYPD